MLSQEPVEKKLRRKTNLEDAMILPKVRKKLSYNPAKEKNLHKYEDTSPQKNEEIRWISRGFFSYAAQYFSGNPGPGPFCGGKTWKYLQLGSIELNFWRWPTLTPNAQPVWRSCLSTSTISLEESGGKAKNHGQLAMFFPGRKICQKKTEKQKKLGKNHPPKEDV